MVNWERLRLRYLGQPLFVDQLFHWTDYWGRFCEVPANIFQPTLLPNFIVSLRDAFHWCFRFYKRLHSSSASSQFNSSLSRLNSISFRVSGDELLHHVCIISVTARWGKWFVSDTMYIWTVRSHAELYYLLWAVRHVTGCRLPPQAAWLIGRSSLSRFPYNIIFQAFSCHCPGPYVKHFLLK